MAYWYADSAAADDTADGRASVALSFTAASIVATGTHTWQITDANEAPFGSVVVGDHICLVSAAVGTDYGWYEVTEVTSAIRLQLLYLAGTEHPEATAAYNSTSGPKKTPGALETIYGAQASGQTFWWASGTYNLEKWYYINAKNFSFRGLPKNATRPILTNAVDTGPVIFRNLSTENAVMDFHDIEIRRGSSTSAYLVYISTASTRMEFYNCTLNNQDYAGGNNVVYVVRAAPAAGQGVILDGCLLSGLTKTITAISLDGCDTFIASNCTVDSALKSDSSGYFIYLSGATGQNGKVVVEDCGSADSRLRSANASSQFLGVAVSVLRTPVSIRRNYISYANLLYRVQGSNDFKTNPNILLDGNDFERAAASTYPGIQLGFDRPYSASWGLYSNYKHGRCIVTNNTFREVAGTSALHMLAIAFGVEGALIGWNKVYCNIGSGAAEYGIVLKGNGCLVVGNKCYGTRTIYVDGGKNNLVVGNSAVGTVGYACRVGNQDTDAGGTGTVTGDCTAGLATIVLGGESLANDLLDGYELYFQDGPAAGETRTITGWVLATKTATVDAVWAAGKVPLNTNTYYVQMKATGNVVTENVLQAEAGADCIQVVDFPSAVIPVTEQTAVVDRNLYYPESGADLALIGASTLDDSKDEGDLRDLWQTASGDWEYRLAHENDQNSQVGNPLFKNVTGDPDTDDWTLLPASPASDMGGDGQAIGAGGAMGGGGGGGFVRI